MNYRICIHLTGGRFDAARFASEYGAILGGRISSTKRLTHERAVQVTQSGWIVEISDVARQQIDGALEELLRKTRPVLLAAKEKFDAEVIVSVIQELNTYDDARGIFIDPENVKLLAELNAGFEFDLSLSWKAH